MKPTDYDQLPADMQEAWKQKQQKPMVYGARICPNCGWQGMPKKINRGSGLVAVALWLFFLLPGIIYSLWRLTARKIQLCPRCGKDVS